MFSSTIQQALLCIRIRWCAWRESNPLPCGPETRITQSILIFDVPRRASAYSPDAIRVRVMRRHVAAFAGIRDPVVIPRHLRSRGDLLRSETSGGSKIGKGLS